jgi:hypothetical protein
VHIRLGYSPRLLAIKGVLTFTKIPDEVEAKGYFKQLVVLKPTLIRPGISNHVMQRVGAPL